MVESSPGDTPRYYVKQVYSFGGSWRYGIVDRASGDWVKVGKNRRAMLIRFVDEASAVAYAGLLNGDVWT